MSINRSYLGKSTDLRTSPEVATSHVLHLAATMLERRGFKNAEAGALTELQVQIERYLMDLIDSAKDLSEACGRSQPDVRDLGELINEENYPIESMNAETHEIRYGRMRELRKEGKRDRVRHNQGKEIPSLPLSRRRIALPPKPPKTISLSDTEDPLPSTSTLIKSKKTSLKRPDYLDDLVWVPDYPPRHTWKRTFEEMDGFGGVVGTMGDQISKSLEKEKEKRSHAVIASSVSGAVKPETTVPITTPSINPPTSTTETAPPAVPSTETTLDPAPASAPIPIVPEPIKPHHIVKQRKTTHLSANSIKYLVSTLTDPSSGLHQGLPLPLELGIVNHRRKPLDGTGTGTGGEGKRRGRGDGGWIVPGMKRE